MHDPDFYSDIIRIEKDKAQVLTSVAELFNLLAEERQCTKVIAENVGSLIADVLRLGSGLGLAYEDMYLAMDVAVKRKFTA